MIETTINAKYVGEGRVEKALFRRTEKSVRLANW